MQNSRIFSAAAAGMLALAVLALLIAEAPRTSAQTAAKTTAKTAAKTAAKTTKPLEGMTAVEASKGFDLPSAESDDAMVSQGRYLVGLLGCASCHTDGALIGKPDAGKMLAGSTIGIAYSDPMANEFPGAVYPPNLTPDDATGIGSWSIEELVTVLRSGKNRHGRQTMAIMPWTSYAQLSDTDAEAIARYLKALPPVSHKVPAQVLPGNPARTPLVHVGLYRSR